MERKFKVGDVIIGNESNRYGVTSKGRRVIVKKLLSGNEIRVSVYIDDLDPKGDRFNYPDDGRTPFDVEEEYFDLWEAPIEVDLMNILTGGDCK